MKGDDADHREPCPGDALLLPPGGHQGISAGLCDHIVEFDDGRRVQSKGTFKIKNA